LTETTKVNEVNIKDVKLLI